MRKHVMSVDEIRLILRWRRQMRKIYAIGVIGAAIIVAVAMRFHGG